MRHKQGKKDEELGGSRLFIQVIGARLGGLANKLSRLVECIRVHCRVSRVLGLNGREQSVRTNYY